MVGVSGHRDLDPGDSARLREAVTDFVQQLRSHLPDTELRLIVGMAQGADLLVAETALGLGVPVEAVLPMPLESYAADFDAPTLACLRELLRSPQVRCVELSAQRATAASPGPHSREQRDAMYTNLTDTLIRRSSLLLALWDGRGSHLPGGTADTVLRYLGARTDDNRDDDRVEFLHDEAQPEPEGETSTRLVYWTPALRSGAT